VLFFKKKKKEEVIDDGEPQEAAAPAISGNLEAELIKITSRLEAFGEVRKSNSERFSRISEQIGELRGMIVDTNKTMTNVEVASTKAVDLVNAVHPDQLMVAVRKSEGKVESLKANIEANESMMRDILEQLKGMRKSMSFYKGTEQVVKLNQEVKEELFNVKKMQSIIGSHADRVNTIFLEVEKRFSEFNKFGDTVKDLGRSFEKLASDFDRLRVTVDKKEEKAEFVSLLNKFNKFEKHTSNILKLLDVKVKMMNESTRQNFLKLAKNITKELNIEVDPDKIQKETEKELNEGRDEEELAKEGEKKKKPSKLAIKSLFKKKDKKSESSSEEKKPEETSKEEPPAKENSEEKK